MWRISILILGLVVGCAPLPQRQLLTTWRAKSSTPNERLEAVAKLIQVGTTGAEVKKKLGSDGHWNHWHGSAFNIAKNDAKTEVQSLDAYDEWSLDYNVSGGIVSLIFEKPPNQWSHDDFKFVRAEFRTVSNNEINKSSK